MRPSANQETEVMIQVLMDQSLLEAYAEHLLAFERVHRHTAKTTV